MLRLLKRDDWPQLIFLRYRWLSWLATLFLCLLAGSVAGWLVVKLGPLMTAGLVCAVAGGLWLLRDIQVGYWAMVGVICLLPFAKLPFDIGFKFSFLDIVMGGLFFVWLLQLMTGVQKRFVASKLDLPVFIFLLLAMVTFVAGLAHAPLSKNLLRNFVEVLLSIVLFYIVINTVHNLEHLEHLARAIILLGVVASVVGIALYILPDGAAIDILSSLARFDYPVGPGVLRYIREDPALPQRATGTSVDPNVLGGLLIMIGGLLAPQVFASKPVFPRWLVVLFGGLVLLCLLLTFSRGSFMGLGASVAALALLRYRKLGLLIVFLLLLVWLLPITQGYVNHFVEGLQGKDLATQMRFGEYRDALTLIGRYPILGVGFAGSPDIDLYISVANVYLLIAVEMGLLGLASFVLVIVVLFFQAWNAWRAWGRWSLQERSGSTLEPIWYGFHAALLGALAGGFFDHYFFNLDFHHSVSLFWLFVGLATVASQLVAQPAPPSAKAA